MTLYERRGPVRRVLARAADQSDWAVIETRLSGEALAARLTGAGLDPTRVRDCNRDVWRSADHPDFAVIGMTRDLPPERCERDFDPPLSFPLLWAYDAPQRRWLSPDEPLTLDRGPAPQVSAFGVTFAYDVCGWMEVEIAADGQTATFQWSSCFDPFPPLLDWLEDLTEGAPRTGIDLEGVELELHVWPRPDDQIRLLVRQESRQDGEFMDLLNVVASRRAVIGAFYGAVLTRWRETWLSCGWVRGERPRDASKPPAKEGEYDFYPLRSVKVEAYLGWDEA